MYKDPDYKGQDIIDPVPGPVEGYLSPDELTRVRSLYAGKPSGEHGIVRKARPWNYEAGGQEGGGAARVQIRGTW